jgi:hypothetical protein
MLPGFSVSANGRLVFFPPPTVQPQLSEVLVLGDDHSSGFCSERANRIVSRASTPGIGDVLIDVTERCNLPRQRRRELGIDEEAQSCAPQDGMIVLPGGELQNCGDVVRFEVGIIREDLFPRRTSGEQLEHVLHANAEAPNTRAATAHIR